MVSSKHFAKQRLKMVTTVTVHNSSLIVERILTVAESGIALPQRMAHKPDIFIPGKI